jgi:hypothetical protein
MPPPGCWASAFAKVIPSRKLSIRTISILNYFHYARAGKVPPPEVIPFKYALSLYLVTMVKAHPSEVVFSGSSFLINLQEHFRSSGNLRRYRKGEDVETHRAPIRIENAVLGGVCLKAHQGYLVNPCGGSLSTSILTILSSIFFIPYHFRLTTSVRPDADGWAQSAC